MLWEKDLANITHILFYLEKEKEIEVDIQKMHVSFFDWIHDQIANSEFAEPKEITDQLKDPFAIKLHHQDEGELPFDISKIKDSPERDEFIVSKVFEYFNFNHTPTEKKAFENFQQEFTEEAPKLPQEYKLDELGERIKDTGRDGLVWYHPTSWDQGA